MMTHVKFLFKQFEKYCHFTMHMPKNLTISAFTLVEMLMALLIVSVILSASLPVISSRTKSQSAINSKYSAVPIGMIAMWKVDGAMPDNTWLEANGQVIPNGIEYEECRRVYGARLPDLRGADSEFYDSLNNYLSKDVKDYLQNVIKPIPQNLIAIWGTNAAIPEGWSEATEYRGVFLRGYGGNSAAIGVLQEGTGIGSQVTYGHEASVINHDGVISTIYPWIFEADNNANRHPHHFYRVRPINKAVRYIKYSNTPAMPDMPEAPSYTKRFRYIIKVRN